MVITSSGRASSLMLPCCDAFRGHRCVCRMVRNISRGEEGRVMSEDLHRILGETC